MRALLLLLSLLTSAAMLAACSASEEAQEPSDAEQPAEPVEDSEGAAHGESLGDASETDDAGDEDSDAENGQGDAEEHEPVDPAEVGANELGAIPVLMYHGVVDEPADEWQVSPEQFREDLEFLHAHDYYPVQAVDLARGELDVPAGKSPVVLTFDDTLPSQFDYDDDGDVASDTAVGIMLDFAEANPDFPAVGSFYVTDNLFRRADQGPEMLAHLDELGFEVANHTIGHANLRAVSSEEAVRQLALGAEQIREAIPGAEVATMSLPLGLWPDPREIAYQGEHEGTAYNHEGVLLVGANPAPSPFDADFDPLAIPRILAQPGWDGGDPDFMSGFWLDWLENDPDRKYVSDGDPETVSFPAHLSDRLDPAHAERANPYED